MSFRRRVKLRTQIWANMADDGKRERIASARKKLKQFQKKGSRPNNSPKKTKNTESIPEKTDSCLIEDCTNSIDVSSASSKTFDTSFHCYCRTTASTESLQQLSRQLNGLINEVSAENDDSDSSVIDLEKRNKELASLLEHHDQTNKQLNSQITQVRQHAQSLESQLEQERVVFFDRQKKEVGNLKEQLQVHIQTIGILVAEKTECQSQLTQLQKLSDQRFEEIEELSGRLKASRQRVADLERNLSSTTNTSQQLEKSHKDSSKDVDRLKLELYKSNKSQDELKQQILELQEKVSCKVSQCGDLQGNITDLTKKLEMAELYAQQLSNNSDNSLETIQLVDRLQNERDVLIVNVKQLSEAFQNVTSERDQLSEHYQTAMDQLQRQTQTLTSQLTSLTEEREQMIGRQREMEGYVSELQSKLEEMDSQQHSTEPTNSTVTVEFHRLQQEFDDLSQRHSSQIRDNSQLSRLLEEREHRLLELENTVSRLGDEAGDKEQLLENIQSDKTALSRALAQNKDLKTQLAELQNGFVKMSNDNMDMLTQLQTKEHSHAEIATRLAQQEDDLTNLREQLTQKDVALSEFKEKAHLVNKEMYQQDQIQDRLRHYEAQAQIVDTLQRELHASQDMVEALTTQNSELRTMLIKSMESKNGDGGTDSEDSRKNDVVTSLSDTIQQMEVEKNKLLHSLKDQRELSDTLSVKVADMQEELVQKSTYMDDNNKISRVEFEQLRNTMDLVQDKYSRVMRDKAELTDRAEQLEHIVLQLQGETDTIGEYISLYHHQRALLQQREHQKNDYISQLASDREELQAKLGELQSLVMQLLGEKHMLHSYHEETLRPPTSPDVSIQPHLSKTITRPLTNGDMHNVQNDWPDYTSSDTDSDSEVETIIGGSEKLLVPARTMKSKVPHSEEDTNSSHRSHSESVDGEHTAHRILNLLSEIGHSSLTDKTLTDYHCLSCKYCKGKVQIV
ncbi:hypothetical protein ScPMuIL_009843 [Solemya velum]